MTNNGEKNLSLVSQYHYFPEGKHRYAILANTHNFLPVQGTSWAEELLDTTSS